LAEAIAPYCNIRSIGGLALFYSPSYRKNTRAVLTDQSKQLRYIFPGQKRTNLQNERSLLLRLFERIVASHDCLGKRTPTFFLDKNGQTFKTSVRACCDYSSVLLLRMIAWEKEPGFAV
jgi:hypothetical protein